MKQITETQFTDLNEALVAIVELNTKKAQIAETETAKRETVLQIGATLVTETEKIAAPGVVIQTHRKPLYDANTALSWCVEDTNLVQCAPLLEVRKDMTSVLVGLFLKLQNDHPEIAAQYNLKAIFDLNKSAFEEACRMKEDGKSPYADIPYTGVAVEQRVTITPKNVKTGTELANHFQIVPDVPTEIPAPQMTEVSF